MSIGKRKSDIKEEECRFRYRKFVLLQTLCQHLSKDYRSVIHFKEKLEIEEDILLR